MPNKEKQLENDSNGSKMVGKVTVEERDAIQKLYERKNSLQELFHSLSDMPRNQIEGTPLYEKLVDDMGKTATAFKNWWNEMSAKYKWTGSPGHSWRIDFSTGEVFLSGHHHGNSVPTPGQEIHNA